LPRGILSRFIDEDEVDVVGEPEDVDNDEDEVEIVGEPEDADFCQSKTQPPAGLKITIREYEDVLIS
jgi:hypothetical protein